MAPSRPRTRQTELGYSLMEVLVMLAITAVVSALVLQTVRAAAATGIRIERHSRTTIHDRIDIVALRRAMAATLIDYAETGRGFEGTPDEATGLTTRPMASAENATTRFRLSVDTGTSGSTLFYEEDDARFELVENPAGRLSLSYWNDNGDETGWVPRWPPENGFEQIQSGAPYYAPLPSLVRISSPDSDFELIIALARTAPPPPRVEDLLRTGEP